MSHVAVAPQRAWAELGSGPIKDTYLGVTQHGADARRGDAFDTREGVVVISTPRDINNSLLSIYYSSFKLVLQPL